MPSTNPSLLSLYRLPVLVYSFLGTLLNLVLTVNISALRYTFRWEAESIDWEWLADKWRVLSVLILISSYFFAAAAISAVGLTGVIKNKRSLVRFYRDYYIADFAFCASSFTLVISAAFQTPVRTGICEEFARYPELVRDMQELGINVGDCELWLSCTTLAFAALLFTVIVVRFHVLFALSSYHSGLSRRSRTCCILHYRNHSISHSCGRLRSDRDKRIFFLLVSPEDAAEDIEMVYAPVPIINLQLPHVQSKVKEAWLSDTVPAPSSGQQEVACMHHDLRWHSRSSSEGINNNTNQDPVLYSYPCVTRRSFNQ